MKSIRLENPGNIFCTEADMPVRKRHEALIRLKAAGICGSDIGAFRGTNKLVSYPRVIGHELAGVIEEIDDDNPGGFKKGDRIIVDPYLYCGTCYPCSIGRTNCCTDLHVLGVHTDGGMAEYFVHPDHMLIAVPEGVEWIEAALAEPLTIALHGVHRGRLKAGETCVVFGAGAIGILAGMAAKAYGANVILIDVVQERLDFAAELGIGKVINSKTEDSVKRVQELTKGVMAQLVMECSGANQAIRLALDLASHAGRITLTGWPSKDTLLPTDMITRKELDILGARNSVREFGEVVELIRDKQVDVRKILTKCVTMEEVPEMVRRIEKEPGNYLKVVAIAE